MVVACCLCHTGHVWNQRRGVSQSSLRAVRRGRGQCDQHDLDGGGGHPAAGQRQDAVGHPEGPAGHLSGHQGAVQRTFHLKKQFEPSLGCRKRQTPGRSTSHSPDTPTGSVCRASPRRFSSPCTSAVSPSNEHQLI